MNFRLSRVSLSFTLLDFHSAKRGPRPWGSPTRERPDAPPALLMFFSARLHLNLHLSAEKFRCRSFLHCQPMWTPSVSSFRRSTTDDANSQRGWWNVRKNPTNRGVYSETEKYGRIVGKWLYYSKKTLLEIGNWEVREVTVTSVLL